MWAWWADRRAAHPAVHPAVHPAARLAASLAARLAAGCPAVTAARPAAAGRPVARTVVEGPAAPLVAAPLVGWMVGGTRAGCWVAAATRGVVGAAVGATMWTHSCNQA